MSIIFDTEIEFKVLGLAFNSFDDFNEIAHSLEADDFFDKRHQLIFLAIQDLYRKGIENSPEAVSDSLGESLNTAGGLFYLLSIKNTASIYELKYLIDLLKEKSHRREILSYSCVLSKAVQEEKDYDSFIASFASKAYNLFDRLNDETLFSVAEICKSKSIYIKAVENQQAKSEGKEIFRGHKTTFIDIDRKTSGLAPGNLIIVGARPGCGKSTLMINLVSRMKDCKAAVFSLEMTAEELATKLILLEAKVGFKDYNTGLLGATDVQKLYGVQKDFEDRTVFIDEQPGLTPCNILGRARSLQAAHGLDIIFIDYLQLMRGNEGNYESNQVKVASISRELKEIAKTLKVPVVALAQLNRQVETREGGMPKASDLRESGSLEADADQIWLLHKDDVGDFNNGLDVIIAKNRFGETGMVKLNWNLSLGSMESRSW